MPNDVTPFRKTIHELEKVEKLESLSRDLLPLSEEDILKLEHKTYSSDPTLDGREERIKALQEEDLNIDFITGRAHSNDPDCYKGNIENFIGFAQIPIGLAGPIFINGKNAKGDFFIPLATTEGALVASYSRGMKACRMSGGVTTVCLFEGVQRSPYFKFENILVVGNFLKWVHENLGNFREIVSQTSSYANLNELRSNIEGNSVILTFEFQTGDAAGQNMVTICTHRVCMYILEHCPIKPESWYIESNYSGDKKATALSFSNVRGKKVVSEVVISRKIVEEVLKSTPEAIADYWKASTLAVTQSGAIGAQGHIANGLTALFIACGQDVACIAESSIGLTRMEVNKNKDLYVSVTLPSLIVGTVGGGTGLPTQKECLSIMDCYGVGKAQKFAEICCAVALTGELSIAAAMSVDHFSRAHEKLGRKK